MNDIDLGWLAGVLDSEGAVGIRRCGQGSLEPLVQMETTCERTSARVLHLMEDAGIRGAAYFYRGRKPQHKGSWSVRVARMDDVRRLSEIMVDVAVTKAQQWRLIREFTTSRLKDVALDEHGRVRRGGAYRRRPYSRAEIKLYERIRALNARGPSAT